MKYTTVFARQFALAKTHFRLAPKIQPVRLLRVGKASSQKTEAEIPNVFPLLPLVTNKIALSGFSENIDSLFRQRKSNLFVSPPLATNTTLITATLKSSDSMSPFQKYKKVKHPTLLVMKGDTSNVNDNDGINRVDKNTELEMITCIVPTNEGEIKDGESDNNDNMTLAIESGNIEDTKEDTINGQDTNNNDSINRVDNNRKLDGMIISTNKDDYKKAIVTEVKDNESDNNDNMTLAIESGNIEDTKEDTINRQDTNNNDSINRVDNNRKLDGMIISTNKDDYKKAIVAEVKDNESDNNDNMTLVIDGNDESGNIEDTEEDTINGQDTNNVDDNDGKHTKLEMITCIVPTNKGDYKKAIVAEVKDGESDNNDNMMLVIDGNNESGNIKDIKKDTINGQDINNVNNNDSIINHVDNNRELDGIITCIISTNEDDYKKAIVAEVKDSESDNNDNVTLVIDENNKSGNIEDTTNEQDTSNVDDDDSKNIELEMITCIVPTNQDDYKKAIVAEVKDDKSDNNDNMTLVIDGNNESGNIENTTNGQDTNNVNNNDSIINRVDNNRELDGMIIFTNKDDYKKAIITEVKDNESDNNDNMTLVIDGNDESGNIGDMTNGQDTSNVDDNDSKNTELEMITCIVPTNQDDYKKTIVAEVKDDESDNNDNMMLVIDENDRSDNIEDTTNGQNTSNVNDNGKNTELEMITCIVPTNQDDYKKAIVAEVKDDESNNNDNMSLIDENDRSGNIEDSVILDLKFDSCIKDSRIAYPFSKCTRAGFLLSNTINFSDLYLMI
ncbi:9810_t:CDS:1 [Ambispora gerdemannii]|uniref:9810_t:CDS:1 n=1 Tax=Ambispora gerdemannii TaxID=144530 RepID=A0A9N9FYR0_9GLOM|nr:9810_t:CDS:1 [Ambispora gerdemannii]